RHDGPGTGGARRIRAEDLSTPLGRAVSAHRPPPPHLRASLSLAGEGRAGRRQGHGDGAARAGVRGHHRVARGARRRAVQHHRPGGGARPHPRRASARPALPGGARRDPARHRLPRRGGGAAPAGDARARCPASPAGRPGIAPGLRTGLGRGARRRGGLQRGGRRRAAAGSPLRAGRARAVAYGAGRGQRGARPARPGQARGTGELTMRLVKIGLASVNTTVGATHANVERALRFAKEMAAADVTVAVYPEQMIGGYPPEDLIQWQGFVEDQWRALEHFARETRAQPTVHVLGVAILHEGLRYGCSAVVAGGEVRGLVPKEKLPTYSIYYEGRTFSRGYPYQLGDHRGVPFGDLIFEFDFGVVAPEVCEDAWTT